jgi:hypothetical protein
MPDMLTACAFRPGLGKGKNVTIRREIFRQDNAQTDESTFRIDGE